MGTRKDHTSGIDTWNFHMGMHNEYYRTSTEWDTPEAVAGSAEFKEFR